MAGISQKAIASRSQIHCQKCEVRAAIRQQRKGNEEQRLIGRTDKRQRAFVIADQRILKLLSAPGCRRVRRRARSEPCSPPHRVV